MSYAFSGNGSEMLLVSSSNGFDTGRVNGSLDLGDPVVLALCFSAVLTRAVLKRYLNLRTAGVREIGQASSNAGRLS